MREAVGQGLAELVHQRQQPPQFALRKLFAREPVQVMPRQVGDPPALVLAERHLAGDEQFKVLALHAADDAPFESAKPCVAKWRAVTSRGGTPIPGGTG